MDLLRPLFEAWLMKATEQPLPGWQARLLAWGLRRDEELRCLALELAEFNEGEAPESEQAPDLRPRLRALIAPEASLPVEAPLFPSGWIPAGALAALVIAGLVALAMNPSKTQQAEASSSEAAKLLEEASPTPTATSAAPTGLPTDASAAAASATAQASSESGTPRAAGATASLAPDMSTATAQAASAGSSTAQAEAASPTANAGNPDSATAPPPASDAGPAH